MGGLAGGAMPNTLSSHSRGGEGNNGVEEGANLSWLPWRSDVAACWILLALEVVVVLVEVYSQTSPDPRCF